MTINTTIPSICFSASLPEAISISTTYDSIEARVFVGNTLQWTEELFAFQGEAILYDIRTVIESVLRAQNNALGACELVVKENGSYINGPSFSVLMADEDIPSPATWLQSHFLTTKTAFSIGRTAQQNLYWYVAQGETAVIKITARYVGTLTANGQTFETEMERVWTYGTVTAVNDDIMCFTVNVATIETHFNKTLLSFTVECGANRKMTFFIIDNTASLSLRFRNMFNLVEIADLFIDTNKKVKMESSEAKALRTAIQYDFQREVSYEVESGPISSEDAKWLAQLVSSRQVEKKMPDGSWQQIIIDGESEISDKANAENVVKFSYKMARE